MSDSLMDAWALTAKVGPVWELVWVKDRFWSIWAVGVLFWVIISQTISQTISWICIWLKNGPCRGDIGGPSLPSQLSQSLRLSPEPAIVVGLGRRRAV